MGGNSSKPIAGAADPGVADLAGAETEENHPAAVPPSDGSCPLLNLPNEVLAAIPMSLTRENETPSKESLDVMARLARTEKKTLNVFFQPILLKQKPLALVLSGREAQAEAMIKANPALLLERTSFTTAEGRTYKNVTVYEAALYVGDTQMCEMMHKYFDQLPSGEEERIKQYTNVFPEGVDAVVKAQEAYDFDAIITAISVASDDEVTAQLNKEQNDSALCQAFNEFREEFTELTQAEKHANLKHLLASFTLYANDTRLNPWNGDKLDLFWRQAIGFVQRYLPACDKQVFHQGLYDVVENNERLARLEEFKYGGGSLRVSPDSSGAGFDFAAGLCGGARRAAGAGAARGAGRGWPGLAYLGKLMSNKNVKLAELMPRTDRTPGVVIP